MKLLLFIFLFTSSLLFSQRAYIYASFDSLATTSNVFDKGSYQLLTVDIPSAFTNDSISFTHSNWSDSTFLPYYFNDVLYEMQVGTSTSNSLNPDASVGIRRFFKIISVTAQADDRQLKCGID